MRVLITGGAGFIGANVAVGLAARHADWEILALDSLRRRGSELNLPRLRDARVQFIHGDVRIKADLMALRDAGVDVLLECSAEPSVMAGIDEAPDYVVQANLVGAYHCFELARLTGCYVIFLSTSRVYPVEALQGLALREAETRFELCDEQPIPGASADGISEAFPLTGPRTIYGTTKLAAEMLIDEYRESYGVRAVVDRCGVIAGPWQMGKVDQGVFTYWMLAHYFRRPLEYIGFGGSGKQVRDVLHVDDLLSLLELQLLNPETWCGQTVNVSGGRDSSLSLLETTRLCQQITGNAVQVTCNRTPRPGDVPLYIGDCARLFGLSPWRPKRSPNDILAEIYSWIHGHEDVIHGAL